MVQYCKTCEVSHNKGTECDCGHWAVCNGAIEPGKRAIRIEATLPFRALCKFIASGAWDGVSEITVLSLQLRGQAIDRPHRWVATYYPDDIWGFVHECYAPSEVCYLPLAQELFSDPGELLIAPLSDRRRLEVSEGTGGMVIV